ncbi:putative lipoprotein [Arachnia propionica F0230a]|nr:putative lipoprotein [Arachnia propionica F0230a]
MDPRAPLVSFGVSGCSRLWSRFTWNARRKSPTVILRITHFPQEN